MTKLSKKQEVILNSLVNAKFRRIGMFWWEIAKYVDGTIKIRTNSATLKALEKKGHIKIIYLGGNESANSENDLVELIGTEYEVKFTKKELEDLFAEYNLNSKIIKFIVPSYEHLEEIGIINLRQLKADIQEEKITSSKN